MQMFADEMRKTVVGQGLFFLDGSGEVCEIYSKKITGGKGLERIQHCLYLRGVGPVLAALQGSSPDSQYYGCIWPDSVGKFAIFCDHQLLLINNSRFKNRDERYAAFINFRNEINAIGRSLRLSSTASTPTHIVDWARLWLYGFLRLRYAWAANDLSALVGSYAAGWEIFKCSLAVSDNGSSSAAVLQEAMAMLGFSCSTCGNRDGCEEFCTVCERLPKSSKAGKAAQVGAAPEGFHKVRNDLTKGDAKGKSEAELGRMLIERHPEFKDYWAKLKAAKTAGAQTAAPEIRTKPELFVWLVNRQDLVSPRPTAPGSSRGASGAL
jgi:hypothetical protein